MNATRRVVIAFSATDVFDADLLEEHCRAARDQAIAYFDARRVVGAVVECALSD